MNARVPIGNPWSGDEVLQYAPLPPWTDADLASREAMEQRLASLDLPVAAAGGFWFAFVDREEDAEREVRLFTDVARPSRVVPMQHHGGGVHSLRFPAGEVDRLEYAFQLVDGPGRVQWITDPRNERRVVGPFGEKSEARAPGYVEPAWVSSEPERRGMLREIPIPGPRGNVRPAWIWRAAGAAIDADLPLLVFLDGGDYLRYSAMRRVLDNLIESGALAPCRALFLPPRDRFDEYSANGRTSTWMTQLLPRFLARYFPVPREPQARIGIGASLGALALLHAHWTMPGFFGSLILQSGSFFHRDSDEMEEAFAHFGRICRFVRGVTQARRPTEPVPVRISCGTAEENLVNNWRMVESLRSAGYATSMLEFRDAHNWTAWRDALGGELMATLPGEG